MNLIWIINIVLGAILAGWLLNELYLWILIKRSAKKISQEQLKTEYRKAQLIDVREKTEFDAGHIMGARNVPISTFKQFITSIRKDQPVVLYDNKKSLAARAANQLRKNDYKDVYILKGGYTDWNGKIKKKNA